MLGYRWKARHLWGAGFGVVMLGLLIPVAVRAADDPSEVEATPAKPPVPQKPAEKDGEKEKPDYPPFEEVGKDHELVAKQAFLPLYYNKKKDHLLAVIPKDRIGQNFLLATSISGGPRFTGFQFGHRLVQWQERDKKLLLLEPELRYKMGDEKGLGDVIRRTYTDRIVLAVPIVSRKDEAPVIDLDAIFKNDFGGVAAALGGSMNAELSQWAKYKAFPKNVELEVDAAIMQGNSGTRTRVHYSISEMPETDYQPREADNRIGYFLTAVMDWTRDHKDPTLFHRYIHRWHLRKEDPTAELSDVKPEDQIVFYIEKTVPEAFRPYIREGILEWNKAFEKAGLRNAIAVMQQTDTVHADKDPEDVRYNFFRWIVTGRAFAAGPSRANPITGQILDADVVFDDSLVRVLKRQYATLSAKGPSTGEDTALQLFLQQYPAWDLPAQREPLAWPGLAPVGVSGDAAGGPLTLPGFDSQHVCTYAQGMAHELCFANAVLAATGGGELSDEFIGQTLKLLVTHEVGHTLGLRHNFKASSWLELDTILNNKDPDRPTCASVMDYIAPLFATEPEGQARFQTTVLGPYDYWAIEYGYRWPGEDEKEDEMLRKIAQRSAEPGLDFATDEDTSYVGPDPLVNRHDQSSDPIAYAKHRMEVVRKLRESIDQWSVKDGESYSELRRAFDMLLFEYGQCARYAVRFVGGQYVNRHHKGDPGARPPFEVVPAAKQREALAFIVDNLFSAEAFRFDPALLAKLAPARWQHWESDAFDAWQEYPLHDRILTVQYWPLFHLLNPFTLTRMYDAELQVPADQDALTVPQMVGLVTDAVWSELEGVDAAKTWTDRDPFIPSVRRNLQRRHQEMLVQMVLERGGPLPADVTAVMRATLADLSDRMTTVLQENGSRMDAFSRAHLEDAKARIDKALDADFRL